MSEIGVESGHCCQYARKMEASSIFRPLVGLLLALATVACGSATTKKPTTVEEFIAQIDQLNGQTVMVTGYLGECEALSCMLYRNKAESDEVDRAMSAMRAALADGATDVSGFPFPDHPSVSIGPGSQFSFFDLRAYFYENGYVDGNNWMGIRQSAFENITPMLRLLTDRRLAIFSL